MENFVYLDQEYWESSMKAADIRDMNIIGIDWRQSGLCARRLVGRQGVTKYPAKRAGAKGMLRDDAFCRIFHAVPMLAEGEYIHKRNECPPEQFFCRKLEDFFANLQATPFAMPEVTGAEWDKRKGLLLLVSVPEARLERYQALDFTSRLEQMAQPLLQRIRQSVMSADLTEPGQVKVVLFPRIRVIWERCRSLHPDRSGIGVVQVLEETTQFLLHPGQEVTVSFGDDLAISEDGWSRQYYHKPVRYRENNFLYEPDRFLWQDASYASWYQAFYQICKKVFEAQRWEEECGRLALAGSESCLPCAEKALSDMDAVPGSNGLARANEVPDYLLQWFCRLHGLRWDMSASGAEQGWNEWNFENFRRTEQLGQSGQSGCFGQSAEDIWDI